MKIEEIVGKIVELEEENFRDIESEKRKKEKVVELNNLLIKTNKELINYEENNQQIFEKFQIILKKLKLHSILLHLYKYSK